jgi:hypothetical protein
MWTAFATYIVALLGGRRRSRKVAAPARRQRLIESTERNSEGVDVSQRPDPHGDADIFVSNT